MSRKNKFLSILMAFALPVLIIGCEGNGGTGEELQVEPEDEELSQKNEDRIEKTQKIFYAIPSPMETAALLKKAGAEYNKDILNDVENVDNYTSSTKRALNLGVYGSDLSYTSVFNQTQESMYYTSCAKKLSDKLDISDAFNEETMARMEENMEHRDSLLSIISETYWIVDAYLKENDRDNTSALIIVGGWVEGLYIASQVASTAPTEELRQRIAEQKLSLGDLIALVSTYEEDENLTMALADLKTIQAAFSSIDVGSGNGEITGDDNGVAVIGGSGIATITDDQLSNIAATVKTIRDSYIN